MPGLETDTFKLNFLHLFTVLFHNDYALIVIIQGVDSVQHVIHGVSNIQLLKSEQFLFTSSYLPQQVTLQV